MAGTERLAGEPIRVPLVEDDPQDAQRMKSFLAHSNEGGESWSPFDVVGHLVHGEKTDWIVRAKVILDHGDRVQFEPFDRRGHETWWDGWTMSTLLDEFARLRRERREATADSLGKAPDPIGGIVGRRHHHANALFGRDLREQLEMARSGRNPGLLLQGRHEPAPKPSAHGTTAASRP